MVARTYEEACQTRIANLNLRTESAKQNKALGKKSFLQKKKICI